MGCDDGLCLPIEVRNGVLGSPYFWYLIIITLIATGLIYWILQVPNWLTRTFFGPLYPGSNAFIWIYSVIYLILLVAILVGGWDPRNPNSRCMLLVYTLILILTVAWVAAIKEKQFGWSYAILAFLMLLSIWLIWLTNPNRCGPSGYFAFAVSILYLMSLIVGIYYNYKLATFDHNKKPTDKDSSSKESKSN